MTFDSPSAEASLSAYTILQQPSATTLQPHQPTGTCATFNRATTHDAYTVLQHPDSLLTQDAEAFEAGADAYSILPSFSQPRQQKQMMYSVTSPSSFIVGDDSSLCSISDDDHFVSNDSSSSSEDSVNVRGPDTDILNSTEFCCSME